MREIKEISETQDVRFFQLGIATVSTIGMASVLYALHGFYLNSSIPLVWRLGYGLILIISIQSKVFSAFRLSGLVEERPKDPKVLRKRERMDFVLGVVASTLSLLPVFYVMHVPAVIAFYIGQLLPWISSTEAQVLSYISTVIATIPIASIVWGVVSNLVTGVLIRLWKAIAIRWRKRGETDGTEE